MQVLTSTLDFAAYLAAVPRASARVLLLDYDGTLAPFHPDPAQAVPYPGVTALLREVMAAGTRLVLVTGRPAEELPPLVGLDPAPEIWGGHGWEQRLPDGRIERAAPSPEERAALERAAACAADALAHGARLERKHASIALHWRGLSEREWQACATAARAAWAGRPELSALQPLDFDGGLELRAPGCNKQHAVKAVLATTPADAAVAYLGDDLTDEDAFVAVRSRGVAVLVRPRCRPTAADVWLRPPDELLEFLGHWRGGGS